MKGQTVLMPTVVFGMDKRIVNEVYRENITTPRIAMATSKFISVVSASVRSTVGSWTV